MQSTGYSSRILLKLELSRQVFETYSGNNLMKISPLGADLLQADGQTDRYYEADSRFSQFCESA
jgi:hypothetical protein